MKLHCFVLAGLLFLSSQIHAQEKLELKNQKDKLSYIVGMDIGNDVRRQAVDVDPSIVMRGFTDALTGTRPLLSEQEIRETRAAFQKELTAKQEKQKEIGKKNKEYGEAFLAENKKREGVQTLPSGLQYKVIRAGTGRKPKLTDTVTVDYRATWVNGTEFDSSYERGKPVTVQVNGVIPGWTEALQLMEVGAKWRLLVPWDLAYGEQGMKDLIGPNMTLIFELELLSIEEKK